MTYAAAGAGHGVATGQLVKTVEEELSPVDVLVNITGGPPPPTAVAGQPAQLWSEQFQAMVLSVVAVTDRVLPGMCQSRS
ncbi:SDR family NAD(P)-dependent oxidoreductase [Streptomyces sp. V4I23]|uniref:SDR family NAD(P)-dependent oxidoreductase n=1 Tax=Streptomyces sp. V4I23 TaxID=3042282 RepID=UPI0027D8B2E6|nr:SDR family NAD(P)-dependent oxidoreductase [Streptomyces sp. V4I23]